jgi:hypothetical protein
MTGEQLKLDFSVRREEPVGKKKRATAKSRPRIVYARGFPYGAPLVMLRGGATKDPAVKDFIKAEGFRWDGQRHAWAHYMYRDDFTKVLSALRDMFGCEIVPKEGMDPNYTIDLEA